ncbi:MAG: tetratricopeptide repeat protein [Bacteroidetes bacterium]|jgi:serine/threonine-protein kinase|nr:tetratricopeptide repeat protein [Bacteroidota bacterium]
MKPDRWTHVRTLFEAALERAPSEQAAFLEAACAGDPGLRAAVASLLQSHATDGPVDRMMEAMNGESQWRLWADDVEGRRVGPYALIEELGRGGMGRVFRARRADGQFEQEVALKLIAVGCPSEEARTRFLVERQILASLNHPHIARLLDGGVTAHGQPYFVLEMVPGEPIDQYCQTHRLSIEERVQLLLDICDAVQHAHRQLIVHRDLKPSNILVAEAPADAVGRVKLLDFGIAKLLDPEMADGGLTLQTRTGGLPMTPKYASPEQVRGEAITTASDVYQLGLVLYELLTGQRSYSITGQTPSEIERIVCEEQPKRPSAAVTAASATAAGEGIHAVRRALQGDLDTIVLKALRKEPERRYASVQQLADDLRRYLEGRPVTAHPDSWAYRGRKFVRRHRGGVGAAAIIALLLAGYALTATWHAQRTQAALNRAQQEAQKSEQVTDLLIGMFERANPYQTAAAGGDTLTTRELLDQGAVHAREELSDQPEVQATLMHTLGRINRQLGYHDEAASLLDDALAVQQRHLSPTHPDRAQSLHERARLLRYEGRTQEAARLYRESLAIQRKHLGEAHPDIADNLRELAIIAAREGRYALADSRFREALAMRQSLHGPDHPDVATELHALGLLYVLKQDLAAAERLLRRSLTIRERHVEGTDPHRAETLDRLGQVLVRQDRLDEAEPLLREAWAAREVIFPEVHPARAASLNNIGRLLRKKGDYATADSFHQAAQSIYQQLYGDTNLDVANSLFERGRVHQAKEDYAAAERFYKGAVVMQRAVHGPEHPSAQRSHEALVELYRVRDEPRKADSLHSKWIADNAQP